MPDALAAAILDDVLGLELGPAGQDGGNRLLVEGLASGRKADGSYEITARRLEATSLRVAAGSLVLEIGRLALNELVAQVQIHEGRPRLSLLQAANAELTAMRVAGPLVMARPPKRGSHPAHAHAGASAPGEPDVAPPTGPAWCLGALDAAEGTIRAEIVDAHLLFDADVTVPIRHGQVDFNTATVEHVGPDSRMGVSRMGLYVDAPNGRSYLYQFPSVPIAGVEFEHRGALLGPRVTDRGRLRLQPFVEGLLRQDGSAPGAGVTEQARLLLDRTALSGDVQLSDGRFAALGAQAELAGRAQGRNVVRLHSQAVGRGLTLEMPSLAARNAKLNSGHACIVGDEVKGVLMLRLFSEGGQLRFAFDLGTLQIAGLRLHPGPRG